ncbi:MAG: hypothetical protein JWM54_197 [Acidobacteriaceae bacterium]|nr:hypothetical protein [Acidobacteriaceae bacterium]
MKAKQSRLAGFTAGWLAAVPLWAQQSPAPPAQNAPTQQTARGEQTQSAKPDAAKPDGQKADTQKADPKITAEQAKTLFASVDEILAFASKDTDLTIRHPVKRRLTTRNEVENYIQGKMKDDKDAARLQSSEIVLKKFGLLDRDFQLQPFLVSLLKEQIAGYYDSKTKTVNMLDWIAPDEQKPVLAHELTHALQDQHVDLEKWSDQSKDSIAKNVDEDNDHLRTDEVDTAREAVAEGQAMVVFLDWGLAPKGQSLAKLPDLGAQLDELGGDDSDSPVLKRAPLLLRESLLFPYREGLNFEQTVLKDEGPQQAFSGALDRPPSSTYEVMHPHVWERQEQPTLLTMPDIHSIIDADYAPYDIGVMGAFDVQILGDLFSGKTASASLTSAWDGGVYYAAQSRAAKTPEEKASTKSVALLYLSQWKSADAAANFAAIYAENLKRKYNEVHVQPVDESAGGTSTQGSDESIFNTEEGPVLIATVGRGVFISESFPLPTARKLELAMTGALQHSGEQQAALPAQRFALPRTELSASLSRMLSHYGTMRAELPH